MNNMSHYHKLYAPADSTYVFVGQQSQIPFGVANADRATLINNVTPIAKVAIEYSVPPIVNSLETESFGRDGTPWDIRKSACAGVPMDENHQKASECHSHGCFDAWNRLVREVVNSRNQQAGFWGAGCDCFAF